VVHRSPLTLDEVTKQHGIPVTTPARTLLDLTGLRPRRGRHGGAVLTRAAPLVTPKIEGYMVDFAWPKQRLIAETDGWQDPRHQASLRA
jgi:hypothetical protein